MDLDSFLVSLYVLVDDWWQERRPSSARKKKPGRPALLSDPEVITLAILAQWPRFRSERDFWRFASAHLRAYFPNLCTQSQFNRRVRALELELRVLQRTFAGELCEPSAVYRVLDTTLVPAIPYDNSRRAWSKKDRRWVSGKRQIIEGVICQLKYFFGLEHHREKTL